MKKFKKFIAVALSFLMVCSLVNLPVKAEATTPVQLYGEVTDAGQVVSKAVIDFGKEVSGLDKDTFTFHVTADTTAIREGTEDASYGDYNIDRKIEKVEVEGSVATIYFYKAEGATLAYLSSARNFPATLTYTVTQNKELTVGGEAYTGTYTCDNTVLDAETALFESVLVKDGINYQFYNAGEKADSLVVWFHGNGEGDYRSSNNNVAQMLANRGTVAWASEEAQEIFGGAHVMSFQAPDTWYYAQKDELLKQAHDEIMAVVEKYDINPEKIAVSGCSAGGYMTTRMIIAYPELFAAAMINCPALDVADARGGETPTDEELKKIRDSRTAIWLVQGETDATVNTEACSKRLFNILTEGKDVEVSEKAVEIASDYTTYETTDGKYLMTLYETTEDAKLMFAEDYNVDGEEEQVLYSNHWSWIYTLRNNPTNKAGTSIWQWAADEMDVLKDAEGFKATAQLYATVTDAGQVVHKAEIKLGAEVEGVDVDTFTVHASADTSAIREGTEDASYGDYSIDRTIEKVEVNKGVITLYFNQAEGATLAYLSSARNFPAELTYTFTQNDKVLLDGVEVALHIDVDEKTIIDEETKVFESVIVEDGINYQFYDAGKDANALVVWFHGNGEGDYRSSNNNVAQMLANRGTVAWASEEAQEIFGKAHVMSFQAPDTWYYAQKDGLLAKAYEEIMAVVKETGIDPENILVSGCSAGGYMTTRMIIAYPELFAAAMINCPALDVADARGGETPTDEELKKIRDSRTAIWLVQGETDATVNTEACSKRLFNILTEGQEVTESTKAVEIASDYTTYQTKDGKYLMTLYETTEDNKLMFAEDYNVDGEKEQVLYSNHWSWIYTLRNNPTNEAGVSIWQWAANQLNEPAKTGDFTVIAPYAMLAVSAAGAFVALRKKDEE